VEVKELGHLVLYVRDLQRSAHFYRDILGFPMVHCILAPAWGNEPQPDFVHFFCDAGADARLAFFYYFGEPPYSDPNISQMLSKARHLALLVDTEEELQGYAQRLADANWPMRHGKAVAHELIESIYVYDPNGYNIEISRPLRAVGEADVADTQVSIQALIDVTREPNPTLAKVWARKGELLAAQGK